MIVLKLSVLLVAILQLVSGVLAGTSIYNDIWTSTAIKSELAAFRSTIQGKRALFKVISFPVGSTININEFNILLKKITIRFADVSIAYLEALESVVETGNIPEEEIFEQSEQASKRFRKFFEHKGKRFAHEVRELIGCPVARQLSNAFKNISHQANFIALALHRIEEAIESKENRLEYVKRQAMIIFNRVVKLKTIYNDEIFGTFRSTILRIWQVNSSQSSVFFAENAANMTVNETIQLIASNITILNTTAQNIYIQGQLAIRANLSSAISSLAVFANNTKLAKLSHEISENYARMYHFLRKQNLLDLTDINEHYKKLYENSANIIQNVTDIVIDSTNRTLLYLLDLYANGYIAQYSGCGVTYTAEGLQDIIDNVTQCVVREQTIWNSTIDAFNCTVNLLQTVSNTVASSVARCNNTNFSNDPIMFAKSKACLKTNLKDTARLVHILQPQFEHIDRLIKLDVEMSKFRLKNCLATAAHEITAMQKVSRANLRGCSIRIDECAIDEDAYEDNRADGHHKDGHKHSLLKTGAAEVDIQGELAEIDSEELMEQ